MLWKVIVPLALYSHCCQYHNAQRIPEILIVIWFRDNIRLGNLNGNCHHYHYIYYHYRNHYRYHHYSWCSFQYHMIRNNLLSYIHQTVTAEWKLHSSFMQDHMLTNLADVVNSSSAHSEYSVNVFNNKNCYKQKCLIYNIKTSNRLVDTEELFVEVNFQCCLELVLPSYISMVTASSSHHNVIIAFHWSKLHVQMNRCFARDSHWSTHISCSNLQQTLVASTRNSSENTVYFPLFIPENETNKAHFGIMDNAHFINTKRHSILLACNVIHYCDISGDPKWA